MPDKYPSMTALYPDPLNVEGATYGKRWRRHEWSQLAEAQTTDNPEIQKIVLAIHGGGIKEEQAKSLWQPQVIILPHSLRPRTARDFMTSGFLKVS